MDDGLTHYPKNYLSRGTSINASPEKPFRCNQDIGGKSQAGVPE